MKIETGFCLKQLKTFISRVVKEGTAATQSVKNEYILTTTAKLFFNSFFNAENAVYDGYMVNNNNN